MPVAYVTGSAETGEESGGRGRERGGKREGVEGSANISTLQHSTTKLVSFPDPPLFRTEGLGTRLTPSWHYMCSKKCPDL